jgi:uncharacterized protein (TIGR02246 family)
MPEDPQEIAGAIVGRLAQAWNAADGAAWGVEFVEDADFVNVFGVQFRGRKEIEQRHQYLFDVLFKGSTCAVTLADARSLAPNVILAHSTSVAKIPTGPMVGELSTRQCIVIISNAGMWRIAAVHNTIVTPQL